MATEQERQSIEGLLNDYADALSNAETNKVAGFYTSDAVFMPENGPTVKSSLRIAESAEKFFKTQTISLSFSIKNIVLDQEYAFVTAQATVLASQEGLGNVITRDFFVLKNTSGSWKIFRYIFNVR